MGYNPVTRMMYLADRTNNGIDVIATRHNVVIGLIEMPASSPPKVPAVGPIWVPVTINLKQLIVTGGQQTVYLRDLRAPPAQPDRCTFPTSLGTDTDGATYDPVDETVSIVTDNIGIKLAYKAVVSQTPLDLTAGPSGVTTSLPAAWISVPATVTNELLACAVNPANQTAICGGDLLGDPLIGSRITLSIDSGSGGVPGARGPVTLIK